MVPWSVFAIPTQSLWDWVVAFLLLFESSDEMSAAIELDWVVVVVIARVLSMNLVMEWL